MPGSSRFWGGPERRPWTPKDTVVLAVGLALGLAAGLVLARLLGG